MIAFDAKTSTMRKGSALRPYATTSTTMSFNTIEELVASEHYVVFRRFFPPAVGIVARLREEVLDRLPLMETVFNEGEDGEFGDSKRLQIHVERNTWPADCGKFFDTFTKALLNIMPRRAPNDMVVLYSMAGCQKQGAHSDWTAEELANVVDDGVFGGYSVGCLLALEPDTSLLVWPGSSCLDDDNRAGERPHRVVLQPGDLIVFRADLVHAGDEYPHESNIRLHVYGDSRKIKRSKNTTYRISMK